MWLCGYYCKYLNEICCESLLNGMFVMFYQMVIVNGATSYVIKLHA